MSARLLEFWDTLRSSYWFIPSVMAVLAIALSFATTYADGRLGANWIDGVSWLYANKPDGARTLLSTIAGSMIGVAGVTFSITIASVVYASGQYGPRLLSNFMRDTGNQVTLGTFIATFLYCLLVLRTIRAADEGFGGENPAGDLVGPFVPHVAIAVGLALALASIAVLIYFIHHVPDSIHVSHVISGIGRELRQKVETAFPGRFGQSPDDLPETAGLPEAFFDEADRIESDETGYIQAIDPDTLLEKAVEHDLVIRLRYRPGDFVTVGEAVALAWPPHRLGDEAMATMRAAFVAGRTRTPLQDTGFLVNELVEIAARALSPGVNDPFTAQSCLDWLGAALKEVNGRDFPAEARYDDSGTLRVIARPTTYADLIEAVFGQLRPYVAADRNAALHALKVLGEVAGQTEHDDARGVLLRESEALADDAASVLTSPLDVEAVRGRQRVVAAVLAGRSYEAIAADHPWLGGSG